MDQPTHQTAIIASDTGALVVSDHVPLPALEPDMVLVRTKAVGLNPVDTKLTGPMACPGAVAGCECAGVVVALGSAVAAAVSTVTASTSRRQPLKLGDRVCAPVPPMNPGRPRVGAFAQYVGVHARFALMIPHDMPFESAAALGSGLAAVGFALFRAMPLPGHPTSPAPKPLHVLIYGGSTASGTMALQLCRRAGMIPIATCSPHSFALVESYGADKCFDYRDARSVAAVRDYTRKGLYYALDCISDAASMRFCYGVLGRAGGRYVSLEPYREEFHTRPTVKPSWVLGPALLGEDIDWPEPYRIRADSDLAVFGREWFECAQRLLDRGEIRPHPVRINQITDSQFDHILDGLKLVKEGKLSGEKLVYSL